MASNGVMNPAVLLEESVWFDAARLQEAEARYEEYLAEIRRLEIGQGDWTRSLNPAAPNVEATPTTSLASEIANVRSRIQNYMRATDNPDSLFSGQLVERIQKVEKENATLKKTLAQMSSDMQTMLNKLTALDIKVSLFDLEKKEAEKPTVKNVNSVVNNGTVDEDDDVDLFGSDEETEEDRKIKEERIKAYDSKKAKKAQVIAKSSVVLDVKPWSDETDLKEMETQVRKIESVGLKWGAGKLVPLAYGIKKLQIIAIVEDDNCSIDWLQEQIEAIEDLVQSVDIAAFNKL